MRARRLFPVSLSGRLRLGPPRFGLRLVLLMMLIVCLLSGWIGGELRRAKRQQRLAGEFERMGAQVVYKYRIGRRPNSIIRRALGRHMFATVTAVHFREGCPVTPRQLRVLQEFPTVVTVSMRGPTVGDSHANSLLKSTELSELALHDTNVTSYSFLNLPSAKHITSLRVGGLSVNDDAIREISKLTRLNQLEIEKAAFNTRTIEQLASLRHLRNLAILDCPQLGDRAIGKLCAMPSIRSLDFSGSSISDEGMKHVTDSGLRSLRLNSCTQVTSKGMVHLKLCPKLVNLEIRGTDVGDVGLVHISRVGSLRSLKIGDRNITAKGIKSLRRLKKLTWLELYPTNIDDEGLVALVGHTSLKHLTIGTEVSSAGARRFERGTPNCIVRIYYR